MHYCIVHIFPRRSIILWTKRRPGSRTRASCLLYYFSLLWQFEYTNPLTGCSRHKIICQWFRLHLSLPSHLLPRSFPKILSLWLTILFEISARDGFVFFKVGWFSRFLFGCLEQSFPEDVIKPYEGTSLPSSNVLTYFVSFWLNGWNTDLGLETERHHIASFEVGGDEPLALKSSLYLSVPGKWLIEWFPCSCWPTELRYFVMLVLQEYCVQA